MIIFRPLVMFEQYARTQFHGLPVTIGDAPIKPPEAVEQARRDGYKRLLQAIQNAGEDLEK